MSQQAAAGGAEGRAGVRASGSAAPWWKAGATARVSNCSQAPGEGDAEGLPVAEEVNPKGCAV